MKINALIYAVAAAMALGAGAVNACEYTPGVTKFVDYANCRYGEENILVIELAEGAAWDNCIYFIQAFRPEKLLAVTKERDGKEEHSINDRAQIGNPCYLSKQRCDAALKAYKKKEGLF